jgi:hypothetical protein
MQLFRHALRHGIVPARIERKRSIAFQASEQAPPHGAKNGNGLGAHNHRLTAISWFSPLNRPA